MAFPTVEQQREKDWRRQQLVGPTIVHYLEGFCATISYATCGLIAYGTPYALTIAFIFVLLDGIAFTFLALLGTYDNKAEGCKVETFYERDKRLQAEKAKPKDNHEQYEKQPSIIGQIFFWSFELILTIIGYFVENPHKTIILVVAVALAIWQLRRLAVGRAQRVSQEAQQIRQSNEVIRFQDLKIASLEKKLRIKRAA